MPPEKVISKKKIYTSAKKQDELYDKAYKDSQKIEESNLWVNLYMKVGLYCGWSWKEFQETPYEVIKIISKQIDNKLENLEDSSTFLSWQTLFVASAIAKCFGGK